MWCEVETGADAWEASADPLEGGRGLGESAASRYVPPWAAEPQVVADPQPRRVTAVAVTLAVMDVSPSESMVTAMAGSDPRTSGTTEPIEDMDRDLDRDEDLRRSEGAALDAPPSTGERAEHEGGVDPPAQRSPEETASTRPQGNPAAAQSARGWMAGWLGAR